MPKGSRTRLYLELRHLRALARAVGELGAVRSVGDLRDLAFNALDSFGPGSRICFEKFSLIETKYESAYNGDPPSARDIETFGQLYHQHPYIGYLKRGGQELALRTTDLLPKAKWHKTELFNELYVPNKAPFQLCSRVFVPESNENINFTALRNREFDDVEQALTRVYLEEVGRVFGRLHLSSDSVELRLITQCQVKGLSKREVEVVTGAFRGKTDKEIAQQLGNSVRTVQQQLQTAYRKLGVRSRGEAVNVLLKQRD